MSDSLVDSIGLGVDIAVPPPVGEGISMVLQWIGDNLGIRGQTPHITGEECSEISHRVADGLIAKVLSQLNSLDEQKLLAVMATKAFTQFTNTYQPDVESLKGIRVIYDQDNMKDAFPVTPPAGITEFGTPDAALTAWIAPDAYAKSLWRVGMLVFDNLSPNTDDVSIPQRVSDLYTWQNILISDFSKAIGRTIQPYTTAENKLLDIANSTAVSTGVPSANIPVDNSSLQIVKTNSGIGLFWLALIGVAIYFIAKK